MEQYLTLISCLVIVCTTLLLTKRLTKKELDNFNKIGEEYKEKDNIDFDKLDEVKVINDNKDKE